MGARGLKGSKAFNVSTCKFQSKVMWQLLRSVGLVAILVEVAATDADGSREATDADGSPIIFVGHYSAIMS